jgi:hypothetical protein
MARGHGVKRFGEVSKPILTDASIFGPRTENHDSPMPNIQEGAYHEYDNFLAQGYT